jgi:uncharacterized membrane protein YbjE (DUF340 family)
MKLINFISNILTDSSGNASSKRITGFVLLGLLVMKVLEDNYTENDMEIIKYLLYAVCAVAGIVMAEFFNPKKEEKV